MKVQREPDRLFIGTGNYLLWVEVGELHWLAADVEAALPGDFVAAGWMRHG